MNTIKKQWNGWNNRSGHDKTYHVAIIETASGKFDVRTAWGARGSNLSRGDVGMGLSLATAEKAFEKQVKAKQSKSGYDSHPTIHGMDCNTVFAAFASASGESFTPPALARTADPVRFDGICPMLLNEIGESEVEKYINDPAWGMQQKFDGHRRMALVRNEDGARAFYGINKKGGFTLLAMETKEALESLGITLHVDGEAMGSVLQCFNLLEKDGLDLASGEFQTAYEHLEQLLEGKTGNGLELVQLARTADEKRKMFNQVKAKGGEGVVFIRLASSYCEGRPNSGGDILKFRFKGSASCIVTGSRPGKRSVQISLLDNDSLVCVGNVTIPSNYEVPAQNTLVEVEYLYVKEKGGNLYQPVYKGPRDDIDREECVVQQLKYKDEPLADAA